MKVVATQYVQNQAIIKRAEILKGEQRELLSEFKAIKKQLASAEDGEPSNLSEHIWWETVCYT